MNGEKQRPKAQPYSVVIAERQEAAKKRRAKAKKVKKDG